MESIPSGFEELFARKSYAVIATLLPNGMPHLTVVWVDYDGDYVLINTERSRRKVKNIELDPRVGVCVIDPKTPFRYLSLYGEVMEIESEGAEDHIDALGRQYEGVDGWSDRYEDDVDRVIVNVEPRGVFTREPYGIEKE